MSNYDKMIHALFDESHGSERISKEIENADRMLEEFGIFDSKKSDQDHKEIEERLDKIDAALDALLS